MTSKPEGTLAVFGPGRALPASTNDVHITGDPFYAFYNAFGAVVMLISADLGAMLWYQDNSSATQGALIGYVAGKAGTDPFGNAFSRGSSFSGSGMTNPMTTPGDIIFGGTGGTPQRLGIGAAGTVLTSVSGMPAWELVTSGAIALDGPSAAHQTVWQLFDGSIVVLPLSTYGLSGDDSTWINAAFTFLPTVTGGSGQYGGNYTGPWIIGRVNLLAAQYTINSGIVFPLNSGSTIELVGQGAGTILNLAASITGIYRHGSAGGTQTGVPALQSGRGLIEHMRIDGQSNGGNIGIDWGGGWGGIIRDVQIVNCNGSGGVGLHINNQHTAEWTEKTTFDVDIQHCTTPVLIEQTGGNPSANDSMEYNDWTFRIMADSTTSPAQSGVVIQGGVFLANGRLVIRGNFPTNSGPVLTIQGNDGSGGNSSIFNNELVIGVETAATSNAPQTINFGSSGNSISNCPAKLTFEFGNTSWTATNAAAGQIAIKGTVHGDDAILASIAGVTTPSVPAANTTIRNSQGCDVLVKLNGGTGVNVQLDGVSTGISSGVFTVPANGVVGLGGYSAAPTWLWVGRP